MTTFRVEIPASVTVEIDARDRKHAIRSARAYHGLQRNVTLTGADAALVEFGRFEPKKHRLTESEES